ncbi:unnamed protein product [Didymodactylos carnosus]|uniref:NHL repeat containing protein n=1 Tax=Didymodactylos carnosus TaxID=1234261 RepID=A0A814VE12_9BILA|nr:unnamed protein product [Didymodactylos carnosus]CAF3952009.1 unnamed protein product [Didymodactylos carnosus]
MSIAMTFNHIPVEGLLLKKRGMEHVWSLMNDRQGGGSNSSQFRFPVGLWVDNLQNMYVTDVLNFRVQYFPGVNSGNGTGTTVASGGLGYCYGLYVDRNGSIYVVDQTYNRIMKYSPSVSTTSDIQQVVNAQINQSRGLYVNENDGNSIYIADTLNHRIQKFVNGNDLTIGTTVAGVTGQPGSNANQLANPSAVIIDKQGNLYIADTSNSRIQKWSPNTFFGITVAGSQGGIAGTTAVDLNQPRALALNETGLLLYVADSGNDCVKMFLLN